MPIDFSGNKILKTSIGLTGEAVNNVVRDNLVLFWDVANKNSYPGSGTTLTDLSGNGYNGTFGGSGTSFVLENGYGVLDFNGSGYVYNSALSLTTSNFTVTVGGRYTDYTPGGRLMGGWNNNWLLYAHGSYVHRFYAAGWVSLPANVQNNNWAIATGVGNIAGASYQYYESGSLLQNNNGGSQGPDGVQIGCSIAEYSKSRVSFLLVYNRVLTQSEVTQNFFVFRSRLGL